MKKIMIFCIIFTLTLFVFACNGTTTQSNRTTSSTTQTTNLTNQTPTTGLSTSQGSTTISTTTITQSTMPIISDHQALVVFYPLGGEIDADGGMVSSPLGKLINKGELAPNYDAIREGYTFDGWYTSQDEGVTLIESWDFAQPIDNSLNLYAKWIINRYTITYVIPPENYNPITDTIIFPGETVDFVALGRYHSLMVSSLGRIFSWGFNRYGQLGNSENIDRDNPTHITGFFDLDSEDYIIQLSLGAYHSAALSNEGKIFLWGYNEKGQLGTGYINNYTTPIDITQRFNLQPEEKIIKVKTGDYNTAAITSLGRLFIWGSSSNSLLADGMTWDRATPYDITSEFNLETNEKIVSVEFGSSHVIALTSSGRVFAWGSNFYGQLGDGTNLKKDYPFEITASFSLTGTDEVTDVYAGSNHSAVLTADGRVFTFGYNLNGQLGDDTITDKNSPVEITSNFNLNPEDQIISLSFGQYHSSALSLQGMLYFWGDNTFGQLGNNTTVNEKKPLNITDQFSLEIEEKILQVDLGDNHSAVVTSLGNTYFFGINEFGQLGNGSNDDSLIPVSPNIAPTEAIIQEYDYLETISFYSVPSRPGDSFDAWYLNSIFTEMFSDNLMPSQDLILFARYDSYAYFAYNQDDYLNPGDQVGYYIYLTRTATIIAYTLGDLDTKGELRDSEENVILFDDDSGEDLNFYIEYTLEPGTYYIYVEGYDDDEWGEYQIIIIVQ